MAERPGRFRPELAVPDAATRPGRRLFDCRRIGHPGVAIGASGPFPALSVQLAQAFARGSVTAAGDRAPLVRKLPLQPRVGLRDELLQIRAPLLDPSHSMIQTQPVPASMTVAPAHPAGTATEHRIIRIENQCLAAELGANGRHQPAEQALLPACRRRGHQATCPLSNQPAFSSTARASSTVRCNGDVGYWNCPNALRPWRALADLGGVVGPVSCGQALPGNGDVGVDAECACEDRSGDLGGELEQCGAAGLVGADP